MYAIFGLNREKRNSLIVADYKTLSLEYFHFHSQIEILFVKSGRVEVLIGDKRAVLEKGDVAISNSYEPHSFLSLGEVSTTIAFIPIYMCEDFISLTRNKRVHSPFVYSASGTDEMFLIADKLKQNDMNKIEQKGYIYTLLGQILRHISLESSKESIDASLNSKLLHYINENYKGDLRLSSIASSLGYNPEYISKHFRACFKISLSKYVSTVRLKNAVMLLEEGNYNVTEAAMESGFPSMRTFYRAFGEEFGCTPREYFKP